MAKKVLKFGGTSVGTIERIQHVANIIRQEKDKGHQIIAIVSAMAGKTNELINLSKKLSEDFNKRELDVLLSSGEQITCALLAGALLKLNIKAPNNILPPEINHDPKINDENNLFAKTVRRTEKDALKFIKETNNKDITQVFTSQHSMNQILDKFNTYVAERTRIKMMKKIFKFFIKYD